MTSADSKRFSRSGNFSLGIRKKSQDARSGIYGAWLMISLCFWPETLIQRWLYTMVNYRDAKSINLPDAPLQRNHWYLKAFYKCSTAGRCGGPQTLHVATKLHLYGGDTLSRTQCYEWFILLRSGRHLIEDCSPFDSQKLDIYSPQPP